MLAEEGVISPGPLDCLGFCEFGGHLVSHRQEAFSPRDTSVLKPRAFAGLGLLHGHPSCITNVVPMEVTGPLLRLYCPFFLASGSWDLTVCLPRSFSVP
jgi:hypothetical protein